MRRENASLGETFAGGGMRRYGGGLETDAVLVQMTREIGVWIGKRQKRKAFWAFEGSAISP